MTDLKDKIWKIFDLFRDRLPVQDYYIFLLFIYLRSENIISEKLNKDSHPRTSLLKLMSNWDRDVLQEISVIQRIYNVFLPIYGRLSDEQTHEIIEILNSIDVSLLKENIAEIFDEALQRISISEGKRGGEFMLPHQISQVVTSIIGDVEGLNVYNPFAGVASLINFDKSPSHIHAQELNEKTWAVGQLRLWVNNSSAYYTCSDSILGWPDNSKFDIIVSSPPFNLKINLPVYLSSSSKVKPSKSLNSEEFLLEKGLNSLSNYGKLIAVLSHGVLFKSSSKQLRKKLVQDDLIESVLSFPSGLLTHTGIPFIIIVLNKAKSISGKIKLIDVDKFISKTTSKHKIIDSEKLLNCINIAKEDDSLRVISNQDVIENDFNLNIPKYFQEDFDGIQLSEILTPLKRVRKYLPDTGKFIRIRDLKSDNFDFQLNFEDIEESTLNKSSVFKIDSSCLLLASRFKKFKPTYFHFDKEPIYCSSNILPFHVNESKVDLNYLVYELNAEYVQKQLESFNYGTTIPFIKKDDLLKIKIKCPSIKEQLAKISGMNEVLGKEKDISSLSNNWQQLFEKNYFDDFASLKHTLGAPRQNILSNAKSLIRFFESNNSDAFQKVKQIYKMQYETDLLADLINIKEDVNHISTILEKGENGLDLTDYILEPVSIDGIDNVLFKYKSQREKYRPQYQRLNKDEKAGKAIMTNLTLFKVLVDNILTNADKYAFTSKKSSNHFIFELKTTDESLEFHIRNNGKPFPNNFNKDKFVTKFSTTIGSGIGGYDINRIATYFGDPDWELLLEKKALFPVIFQFNFPLIPLINE